MSILCLFLATLLAWFPSSAHPDSRSSSRVRVEGRRADVELRCQTRSLAEAIALDRDGDGELSAQELEAGKEAIAGYLLARYQLFPGDVNTVEPLSGRLEALRLLPADETAMREAWVEAKLGFDAGADIADLSLRVTLFRAENPYHRDEARIEFNDDAPVRHLFSGEQGEVWRYSPEAERRAGVFSDYFSEGVHHIASGFDHLAFLLALVLALSRWRSVLWVVTAFTVAHSITLALASLELVSVRSSLVEMAIALSIAYVGALNWIARAPQGRFGEAFVFGLIHGLGFAGAIQDALVYEPLRLTALLGFNLGVEAGQLVLVLPVAWLLARIPGDRSAATGDVPFLAPRALRRIGSAAVIVAGLYWFAERAGWIP